MPKAARRQSGPKAVARAEPYPTIKPGDTPAALGEKNSTDLNKSTELKDTTTKKAAAKKPAAKKTVAKKPTKAKAPAPTPAPEEKPTGSYLDVTLPGEDKNNIPLHDTCSEVRRKINSLLSKDNTKPENAMPGEFKKDGTPKPWTKAKFCEQLGVSTRVLDTFMKAKKLMGGAESDAYPAAYRFFEKKRIFEGKKKTAGRLKVESDRPSGLPQRDPNKIRVWVRAGENPSDFLDEYGQ